MNTNIIYTANSGHIVDIQLSDPRQANLNIIPGFQMRDFQDSARPESSTPKRDDIR